MNVLCIDPGGTTGIATYVDDEWRAYMLPYDEAVDEAERLIAPFVQRIFDLVVFEGFKITAATAKKGQGDINKTIEFIGVGRFLARKAGVPFETQMPADAFSFASRAKLAKLGWHTPGPDHADSASKHLVLALARHRAIDLSRLIV
jgi:hypothetical protein